VILKNSNNKQTMTKASLNDAIRQKEIDQFNMHYWQW